ncbi:MAG TPA: helix-turn-helix domain-containing protein, partial [Polyangia bacterium]
ALERAAGLAEPPAPEPQPPPAGATVTLDLDAPFNVGKKRLNQLYEERYLASMLDKCGGNIAEVARRSGLERMSVYRILRRLGMR